MVWLGAPVARLPERVSVQIDPDRLAWLRAAARVSQERLAHEAGLSVRTVARLEAEGSAFPTSVEALASVLQRALLPAPGARSRAWGRMAVLDYLQRRDSRTASVAGLQARLHAKATAARNGTL